MPDPPVICGPFSILSFIRSIAAALPVFFFNRSIALVTVSGLDFSIFFSSFDIALFTIFERLKVFFFSDCFTFFLGEAIEIFFEGLLITLLIFSTGLDMEAFFFWDFPVVLSVMVFAATCFLEGMVTRLILITLGCDFFSGIKPGAKISITKNTR